MENCLNLMLKFVRKVLCRRGHSQNQFQVCADVEAGFGAAVDATDAARHEDRYADLKAGLPDVYGLRQRYQIWVYFGVWPESRVARCFC
jgi:hypothetical protein